MLHIAETRDWVVPTLAGEPFMEKPPFYFITAAFLAKILSSWLPFHDGARLATGLFIALTFLFTGLSARKLYGGTAGWMAPLLLAGCIGLPLRMHQMITDPVISKGLAAIATIFTLGWVAIIRWNTKDPIVALLNWSSGAALAWLLVMTLYLPILDKKKSFKAVFTELESHVPADVNCVTGAYLGEPQLAMLHYHIDLIIHRNRPEPQPEGCRYTLYQYRKDMDQFQAPEISGWRIAWKGRRPADKKEYYVLYERIHKKFLDNG